MAPMKHGRVIKPKLDKERFEKIMKNAKAIRERIQTEDFT